MKVMDLEGDLKVQFVSRKNRFLAIVKANDLDDDINFPVHVHDPGRLNEVLYKGNDVLLKRSYNIKRITRWDVLAGRVADSWVLINSRYHGGIARWLLDNSILPISKIGDNVISEVPLGNSRIDFLISNGDSKTWVEVKGCTLVKDRVALFPDAPTKRGTKHVKELISAVESGSQAALIFLIFGPNAEIFSPNFRIDSLFSKTLLRAYENGVMVYPASFTYDGHSIYYNGMIPCMFG